MRMAWKTVVGVLCVTTIILGTYIKFFDHPAASETLDANRMVQEIEKPSFIKKGPQSLLLKEHSALIKNNTKKINSTTDANEIVGNKTNFDTLENKTIAKDEKIQDLQEQDNSEEVHDEKDNEVNDDRGPHGIKKFDWESWVKENDFVNIGSLWGYCDDDDPPVIGKVILFDSDGTLSLTLVLNTTFDADITFGEVEVKVMFFTTEFYHKTWDLCDMAEDFQDDFFACPMVKGDKYYFKEQPVSRFIPSGTYSVEMSLRNEYGNSVICGQCQFVI